MTKRELRRQGRKRRKKQQKINVQLKKKLFGHLFVAPCIYCKKVFFVEELTIEHIIPLCLGGTNDPSNIALACQPCNHSRGREAWFQKLENNKRYYEQHYPKHRTKDRESSVQDTGTPAVYCEGESS